MRKNQSERPLFDHFVDAFDRLAYIADTILSTHAIIVLLGLGIISTFTIWMAPSSDPAEQQGQVEQSSAEAGADPQDAANGSRREYDRDMAAEGWGYSEGAGDETPSSFGQSNHR